MSFEKIGPYALRRSDLVSASLVIGFVVGGRRAKSTAWITVMIGVALVAEGVFLTSTTSICLNIFLPLWILIAAPAFRSLKSSRDIYLSYTSDGLLADTPTMQTIYKWATISTTRLVGSRLFIMINSQCALVIGKDVTTPANFDALIRSIDEHRI